MSVDMMSPHRAGVKHRTIPHGIQGGTSEAVCQGVVDEAAVKAEHMKRQALREKELLEELAGLVSRYRILGITAERFQVVSNLAWSRLAIKVGSSSTEGDVDHRPPEND